MHTVKVQPCAQFAYLHGIWYLLWIRHYTALEPVFARDEIRFFFALFACFLCRQCGLDGHDYMHLLCWVSLSEGHTQQQRITDKNVVGAVREANSIFDASGHYIITITTERLRVIWK